VVAPGVTLVEPVGDADVKLPGLMPMVVAPVVSQLSVLLAPELMLGGVPIKELIDGFGGGTGSGLFVVPAQFAKPMIAANTTKNRAFGTSGRRGELCLSEGLGGPARVPVECRLEKSKLLIRNGLASFLIARVSIRKP